LSLKSILAPLGRYSLPDLVFVPLVVLVCGGLIFAGLSWRPLGPEPTITETRFTMTGRALAQMIPGPGTTIQLLPTYGEQPVVRLGATASFEAAGNMSAGVGAVIPFEFEARVATRMVRIEAEIQSSPEGGVDAAKLGYFTIGHGDSGWRDIAVTDEWETVGFCFQTRPTAVANNDEAVGIWPDIGGTGRSLLLREIRVTIMPEGESLQSCEAGIGASR
jgi:hypothetical protein